MWPGGWREDEHGNLAYMLRNGEEEPAWACLLCRRGLLHTLDEHELAVDGTPAERRRSGPGRRPAVLAGAACCVAASRRVRRAGWARSTVVEVGLVAAAEGARGQWPAVRRRAGPPPSPGCRPAGPSTAAAGGRAQCPRRAGWSCDPFCVRDFRAVGVTCAEWGSMPGSLGG
jgi:hypothetical protein